METVERLRARDVALDNAHGGRQGDRCLVLWCLKMPDSSTIWGQCSHFAVVVPHLVRVCSMVSVSLHVGHHFNDYVVPVALAYTLHAFICERSSTCVYYMIKWSLARCTSLVLLRVPFVAFKVMPYHQCSH